MADGEVAVLEAVEQLAVLAQLTGTTPEQLRQALLARTVATGGGELITKGHSPTEATYGRDACAKVRRGQRGPTIAHRAPEVTVVPLSPGHLRAALWMDRRAHQCQHHRTWLRCPAAWQEHRHRSPGHLWLRDL